KARAVRCAPRPDQPARRSERAGAQAMTRSPELAAYFQESNAWDADRAAITRRSARLAWSIASVGWLAALMALTALLLLTPLKRVDNSTGVVDTVPLYQGGTDVAESVTRYLLMHYVSVCERFNFSTAESDYEECGSFHTAQRNQAWYAAWNPANPQSPLNVNKD